MPLDLAPHAAEIARRVLGPENRQHSTGSEFRFGTNGSVSLKLADGVWYDHEHEVGGGLLDLLQIKLGIANGDAVEWLDRELGIRVDDDGGRRIVATYPYVDEAGKPLFEVVRLSAPKDFRQRRPDGRWSTKGIRRVPYRLPELLTAVAAGETVYVAEGEKAVEALRQAGLSATCSPGGAGKWRAEYAQFFKNADVVVMPDNDDAGRAHADQVARSLSPVVRALKVLDLAQHEPRLPPKGDPFDWFTLGRTAEDLHWLADGVEAYEPTRPAAPGEQDTVVPRSLIRATPFVWTDPATLPRRQWLYGRHLIRRFLSADIAPGGIGKSSLVIAEALAMVTGRDLLGDRPAGKLRVWLVNLEDPVDELRQRIAASAIHFGITADDIGDRLFVDSGRDIELVIAIDTRDGVEIAVPLVDAVRNEIAKNSIDAMMVDPFVASHAVPENDNGKIAAVARQWANIAEATNCAISLTHHSRKTATGQVATTVEDARGASALVNASRSVRVLNAMSKDEAERAGIDNHRSYFSVTNGKSNLAPPPDKAAWRKFVSVPLGNGSEEDPDGDRVGVVEQWTWPDPFAEVGPSDAKEVQRRIAAGEFRADQRSDKWAGKVVAEVLGFNLSDKAASAAVRNLLKTWVSTGALKVVTRKDPKRMEKQFVEVGQWLP